MIVDPAPLIGTGLAGGLTAAVVAVGLVELPSASILIGGSIVAALGAAFVAFTIKKFAELFKKLDEGPSKLDFFNSNLRLETQSTRHHQSILGKIEKLESEIMDVRDTLQQQFHELDKRVFAIDERHRTVDRLHTEK